MIIVPRLRAIQDRVGYLPDAELCALAKETGTPLYRIQDVASFFAHFRQEFDKPPKVHVQVCRDMTCHLRGADRLLSNEGLGKFAKAPSDSKNPTADAVVVDGVSCLGRCDRAPAICVTQHELGSGKEAHAENYAGRSHEDLERIVQAILRGEHPPADCDLDYKVNTSDNWQIDPYVNDPALPPFEAVRRVLKQQPKWKPMEPPPPKPSRDTDRDGTKFDEQTLKENQKKDEALLQQYYDYHHPGFGALRSSKLPGMGGAGVAAFIKWHAVWLAEGDEKYIVANGDESEPGTFKDRELLLRKPHLVVEGVILAGLLTGATRGYIFIRHEYMEQVAAVRAAIEQATTLGLCGDKLLDSGRSFPVEVFVSPGGYICGEQSALLEAMSDRRAQPRNRPPELMTNGLFDKPTAVNNVETLSWTPAIMLRGGPWYAGSGPRFFSVSGDVNRPGVYEVDAKTTLGDLIEKHCGGVIGGMRIKALATSGPSGGLVPQLIPVLKDVKLEKYQSALTADGNHLDLLKMPLRKREFEEVGRALNVGRKRALGLILGAGIVVYAEGTNVVDQALNFTQFFRNESCGKCVPCRLGSQKLVELGTGLVAGTLTLEQVRPAIDELNLALVQTSICSLGQCAGNPLGTALDGFAEDVRG